MITLKPAHGRDYRSKKAVLADFHDGKDFIVFDMWHPSDGKPINKEQLTKPTGIKFRYYSLTRAFAYGYVPKL
jgi:hypothetical protein